MTQNDQPTIEEIIFLVDSEIKGDKYLSGIAYSSHMTDWTDTHIQVKFFIQPAGWVERWIPRYEVNPRHEDA
jgi:hypothetical protein